MRGSQEGVLIILIASTALVLLLGTIVVTLLIQKKRKYHYQRQLSNIKVHYEKTILQTRLKILEETFRAISENLHDNVGSNISTAMLLLYKDENFTELETEMNRKEALAILDKVVDDLKNIAHSLNPDYLDVIGLNEAVKQRVEQLERTKKYKIDLQLNIAPFRLNKQKQLVLFYIFQEAINNINSHAEADKIEVALQYEKNQIEFCIKDNGKGMDLQYNEIEKKVKGAGLMNMKNHAEMIDAKLEISSKEGEGTRITVFVPDPYN